MSTTLPFDGIKVVDLGSFWAAPYLTAYLGAYGAEVLKIESIQRPDGFRFTATVPELGERWHERSLMWQSTNLNKRDVTLGLGMEEGRELLRRLCAEADVFVENYAARVVEQYGFDYEDLLEINPRMVVLRLPGFGLDGPWRDFVGWGNAFEQLAGLAWVTGYPDGRPQTPGGYIDPAVGMHAAVALLAALEHRDRTGRGQLVEVPQIEVGASMAAEQVIAWSSSGQAPGRQGNQHQLYSPQGVYRCGDDQEAWVALSVRDDQDWQALVQVMGEAGAGFDSSLETAQERRESDTAIQQALGEWMSGQDADDVVDRLAQAGLPASRVLTVERFNEDPHLVARNFYQEIEHPLSGRRRFPVYPMRFSFEDAAREPHRAPAPLLGQHNDDVLGGELGLSPAEIALLEETEVIGTVPKGL